MTKLRFYPYRVFDGVDAQVVVDGHDGVVDDDVRRVRLWNSPSRSWPLTVDVSVPPAELARLVPDAERGAPPLDVVVTVRSISSRVRSAVVIPLVDGRASVPVTIDQDVTRGKLDLEVYVTRRHDASVDDPSTAADEGAVVATTPRFTIEVDEPPRSGVETLEVLWEGFTTSRNPWFRDHPTDLFGLMISTTTDPPTLYLNSDVERLGAVFDSTSTHGRRARVRDLAFALVGHQAWTSMVTAALCELKDTTIEAEAASVDEALEALPPWMANLIRDWAPALIAEEAAGEALEELWELIEAGQWEDILVDRLPNAVSVRTGSADALRSIMGELEL